MQDAAVAPWQSLPDELCKYIAQQYFVTQRRDVVPLLRLVCQDWREAIDRSVETLHVVGNNSWLKTPMPHVQHVTVRGNADANILGSLSLLPRLRRLELHVRDCPNVTFEKMPLLSGLQELSVINMNSFSHEKAEHLAGLTQLTSCSFQHCSLVDPRTFEVLSKLPRLQSLVLKGCYNVADDALEPFVSGCAPLSQLHLVGWCKVSDEGMQKLAGIPTLKDLKKCRFRAAGV